MIVIARCAKRAVAIQLDCFVVPPARDSCSQWLLSRTAPKARGYTEAGSAFALFAPLCGQPVRAFKKSGQALHGTRRTSLPLLPSGPGGVHAPAHAWHLADAHHAREDRRCKG